MTSQESRRQRLNGNKFILHIIRKTRYFCVGKLVTYTCKFLFLRLELTSFPNNMKNKLSFYVY